MTISFCLIQWRMPVSRCVMHAEQQYYPSVVLMLCELLYLPDDMPCPFVRYIYFQVPCEENSNTTSNHMAEMVNRCESNSVQKNSDLGILSLILPRSRTETVWFYTSTSNERAARPYRVPVRERYGSTLLPATREQHDQSCTQSH